jgi:hypothetical protein
VAFTAGTYKGFPDVVDAPADFVSFDCFSSTYGVILGALGCNPGILGDEWGYRYDTWASRRSGLPFPLPRLYRVPMRDKMLSWYGIDEVRIAHETPEDALDYTLAAVRSGSWVIVQADTFHLRHTGFSGRLHYPHRLVVGRADSDRAYIVDAYRGSEFRGWVPTTQLLAALSRQDVPADAMEHSAITTMEVSVPTQRRPLRGERMLTALHDSVGHYLASAGQGPERSGFLAVEDYRRDLFAVRDFALDLNGGLAMDYLAFFGEVASQRRLNARFLAALDSLLPAEALARAVEAFAALADEWLKLRTLYFVGTTGRRPAGDVVTKVATRLTAVLAREREAVEELTRALPAVARAATNRIR